MPEIIRPIIERAAEYFGVKSSAAFIPGRSTHAGYGIFGRSRPKSVRQLPQAFQKNGWVYAATRAVADNSASVPMVPVRYDRGDEPREINAPQLLRLLEHPNPHMTGFEMRQGIAAWRWLSGNAFVLKERNDAGAVVELYLLPSDSVEVVPDPDEYVKGYIVTASGSRHRFPAEDVIHFKEFSPFDPWYGMSRLRSIAVTLEADIQAELFNEAFFRNDATPGGLLTSDKERLSPEDERRIKENWNAAHQGADNSFKVAVLWAGLKWQQVAQTHSEIAFADLSDRARDKILGVLGVPSTIVDKSSEESFATATQRAKTFWTDTVVPLNESIGQTLAARLLPEFGRLIGVDLERDPSAAGISFDYSGVEALSAVLKEQADTYVPLVRSRIILPNEARERLGFQGDIEGGDQPYIPAQGEQLADMLGRQALPASRKDAEVIGDEDDDEDDRRLVWKRMDRRVEAASRPVLRDVRSYFRRQRQRVLDRLTEWDRGRKADDDPVNGLTLSILFDSEQEAQAFVNALKGSMNEAAGDAGDAALSDIDVDDDYDRERARLALFIERRLGASSRLTVATTMTQLERIVRDALRDEWTVGQLKDAILEQYTEIDEGRALNIARTEAGSAVNFGTLDGWRQSGIVQEKEWIDSGDQLVRPTHRSVAPVPIDQPFIVDGAPMMHPLDPNGPADEVVNCRCAMAPRVIRREE